MQKKLPKLQKRNVFGNISETIKDNELKLGTRTSTIYTLPICFYGL